MPVTFEDNGQKIQAAMVNDEPVMLNHMTVDGVTVSQYKEFYTNFAENMSKLLPDNASFTKLEPEVYPMCWQRLVPKIPLVSPRSCIASLYLVDNGDSGFEFMISTKGNDHIVDKMKDKFGDDVLNVIHFNYLKFERNFDACDEEIGTTIVQAAS